MELVADHLRPDFLHVLLRILEGEAEDAGEQSQSVRLYHFEDRDFAPATDLFQSAILGPATDRTLKRDQRLAAWE